MLDGTGDAESKIDVGADSFARLAHLTFVADDTGIDHRTRRRDFGADRFGQLGEHAESFVGAYAAPAGDEHMCL